MGELSARGYAICAEPRSGSTYLGQLLSSTGQMGRPREYFHSDAMRKHVDPDYPEAPEAQLQRALELGTSANGVYGLKVFAEHFDHAAPSRWAARLPNLTFVFLERRDLLGQALSLARALTTGQYSSRGAPQGEPLYDRGLINNCLVGLVRNLARWRFFFAVNGIDPLVLQYEDIMARPLEAVAAIAQRIGLSGQLAVDFDAVGLQIQRDALTEAWRRRFLEESRDLTVFY
jgi:LPS sulfotransferase NodH